MSDKPERNPIATFTVDLRQFEPHGPGSHCHDLNELGYKLNGLGVKYENYKNENPDCHKQNQDIAKRLKARSQWVYAFSDWLWKSWREYKYGR